MISHLQELLEGILCFVDEFVAAPWPKVRSEPVCSLQLLWSWCEASTYQTMLERDSEKRVSFKQRVECKYLRTLPSLPQSSLSGRLTRVVKNATVVWMSRQTRDRKRSYAVVWWKALACSSGKNVASVGGQTWKRRSPAGVHLHPRNLFRECLDDLFDVIDHVNYDLTEGW